MILVNKIKTPDGTIIESKHRHDFVCHTDKNGITICVDGGKDYLKRVGDMRGCEELSIDSDSLDFEEVRELFTWGTYGKNGDEPLQYKPLKDLTTGHINAILTTQKHISEEVEYFLLTELRYRGEDDENK